MAEPKTKKTKASVAGFLDAIKDEEIRNDSKTIAEMMGAATKAKPVMWGTSIVGFGHHSSLYASGKESEWMLVAFAPRKQHITVYLMGGLKTNEALLAKLGKYKRSGGCLHIRRLADVHLPTLKKLVGALVKERVKSSLGVETTRP